MKLIAITSPTFTVGEARFITVLVECGFWAVHVRKPDASAADCAQLLDAIPKEIRQRVVIHQHFSQAEEFSLMGIHLNRRCPLPPEEWTGSVSRSCHSLAEIEQWKEKCNYVFLSPIFDSISKSGYASAFSSETLEEAAQRGLIDDKVIALGGVTPTRLSQLRKWRFGGAAMLGCVNSLASLPEAEQRQRLMGFVEA